MATTIAACANPSQRHTEARPRPDFLADHVIGPKAELELFGELGPEARLALRASAYGLVHIVRGCVPLENVVEAA